MKRVVVGPILVPVFLTFPPYCPFVRMPYKSKLNVIYNHIAVVISRTHKAFDRSKHLLELIKRTLPLTSWNKTLYKINRQPFPREERRRYRQYTSHIPLIQVPRHKRHINVITVYLAIPAKGNFLWLLRERV